MKKYWFLFIALFGIAVIVFAMDVVLCPNCKGNGWVIVGRDMYGQFITNTCPRCGGKGVLNVQNSPNFQGSHVYVDDSENNRVQGSFLFYPSLNKIVVNGSEYRVISSSKRGYRYQIEGYYLYFNY